MGRGLYRRRGAPRSRRQGLAEVHRRVPRGQSFCCGPFAFTGSQPEPPRGLSGDRQKGGEARVEKSPLRPVSLSGSALGGRRGVARRGPIFRARLQRGQDRADCLRFRNTVGSDVAVEALREYERTHPKRLEAVCRAAEVNRVTWVMRRYSEAVG